MKLIDPCVLFLLLCLVYLSEKILAQKPAGYLDLVLPALDILFEVGLIVDSFLLQAFLFVVEIDWSLLVFLS
jgi:hypothetical protein